MDLTLKQIAVQQVENGPRQKARLMEKDMVKLGRISWWSRDVHQRLGEMARVVCIEYHWDAEG